MELSSSINAESHFAKVPRVDRPRSRFNRDSSVITSFNFGQVVPFMVDEVLPGDTYSVDTHKSLRLETLITPVMDDMFLDTFYFFVPNRLVWEHWEEFCGANKKSAWYPTVEYSIPQLSAPASTGWEVGTIADYMGIPTGITGFSVNALPFRAYSLIMDYFFRDENLQDPLQVPVNDSTVVGVNTGNYITDCSKGGKPFIAAKFHDYFTSCLPSPQKHAEVTIPLGGSAPVFGDGNVLSFVGLKDGTTPTYFSLSSSKTSSGGNILNDKKAFTSIASPVAGVKNLDLDSFGIVRPEDVSSGQTSGIYADISSVSGISINDFRRAAALQQFYEAQARGGSRYIEYLSNIFGVSNPDGRLQIPEYLGGNRIYIDTTQVVQQSETGTTPLGDTAAFCHVNDSHSDFTKSFTEHGYLIGLCVARYSHKYQQGLERFWSRKDYTDFYNPFFANLGEQAVLNKEIYLQGKDDVDNQVFGYQEYAADYRYKPSRISGQMRSQYKQSLDSWHFGDYYKVLPTLSSDWLKENKDNVDRALAVKSNVSNQIIADFFIEMNCTRVMPMYSVPGLERI